MPMMSHHWVRTAAEVFSGDRPVRCLLVGRGTSPDAAAALHTPRDDPGTLRLLGALDLARKRRRAEARFGPATTRFLAPGPDTAEAAIDLACAVEANSWKSRAGTALLQPPRQAAFFQLHGRRAAERGTLRLASAFAPALSVAFMAAGALAAVLGLDDLLLLHKRILSKFGLPQTLILIAYAAAALAYLAVFHREIRQRNSAVPGLGLLALARNLGLGLFVMYQTDGVKLAEDSAKFLGIAGWAGFHVSCALGEMKGRVAGSPDG